MTYYLFFLTLSIAPVQANNCVNRVLSAMVQDEHQALKAEIQKGSMILPKKDGMLHKFFETTQNFYRSKKTKTAVTPLSQKLEAIENSFTNSTIEKGSQGKSVELGFPSNPIELADSTLPPNIYGDFVISLDESGEHLTVNTNVIQVSENGKAVGPSKIPHSLNTLLTQYNGALLAGVSQYKKAHPEVKTLTLRYSQVVNRDFEKFLKKYEFNHEPKAKGDSFTPKNKYGSGDSYSITVPLE